MANRTERLVEGLLKFFANKKQFNKTQDQAASDLPVVHPTRTIDDPESGQADNFYGPTVSQRDRAPEVLEEYQELYGKFGPRKGFQRRAHHGGTVEQRLDELQQEMIDGELYYRPTGRLPNDGKLVQSVEPTLSTADHPRLPRDDIKEGREFQQSRGTPTDAPTGKISKEHFKRGETKTAKDLEVKRDAKGKRVFGQRDTDTINDRQERELLEYMKALKGSEVANAGPAPTVNPKLANARNPEGRRNFPTNLKKLSREVINRDAADEASLKAFGKSRNVKSGRLDPNEEDFSLRALLDIFEPNKNTAPSTPQEKAVLNLLAKTTKAANESGRRSPGQNKIFPKHQRSFDQATSDTQRADPSKLDTVQEQLTGPITKKADSRLRKELEDRAIKRQKLKAQRTGKNSPERTAPRGENVAGRQTQVESNAPSVSREPSPREIKRVVGEKDRVEKDMVDDASVGLEESFGFDRTADELSLRRIIESRQGPPESPILEKLREARQTALANDPKGRKTQRPTITDPSNFKHPGVPIKRSLDQPPIEERYDLLLEFVKRLIEER